MYFVCKKKKRISEESGKDNRQRAMGNLRSEAILRNDAGVKKYHLCITKKIYNISTRISIGKYKHKQI